MTNREAINWLINVTADIGKVEHQELWHYEQALSEIREMLESAPEPCKDAVSREAVLSDLKRWIGYLDEDMIERMGIGMKKLPSVQPVAKDTNVLNNDTISRQAAIDEIEERKNANGYRNVAVISELNRLEGYIMRLPSAQPEPCEDTISRADAIRIASGYCHPANVAEELAKLPSVQPDNSCDGCKYKDVDDGVLVPCGYCGRSHPDNYERRTDETD